MSISSAAYSSLRPLFLSSPPPKQSLRSFSRPDPVKKERKSCPPKSLSLRCNAQLLSDLAPATSAAYGTLLIGGGLFAYARSGSKGSILGGLSGAALMAAAYYLMQSPETKELGDAIGFGSALLFSSVFGIRLAATGKLIPSGFLLALSAGAVAVFLAAYLHDKSFVASA